jgi:hypothetical protein
MSCIVYRDTLWQPVTTGRVHSKITILSDAILVGAQGVTQGSKMFGHSSQMLIVEKQGHFLSASEFHERLIVAGRIVTHRHIFRLVVRDKEEAT